MANDRLRSAMAKAAVTVDAIADATEVDPKTVQRWIGGRVPHTRHRLAVAALVREDEDYLWPVAPGRDAGATADSSAEIKAAHAHRADLPVQTWRTLLAGARRKIDLLGYAMLFFPEQHPNLTELLRDKIEDGCAVRIAVADPHSPATMERDELEQLGGTLPDRIRTTLKHFGEIGELPGISLHVHRVHLYNAVYRFDDDMIVTPYLVGAHGYQHPVMQLRRLGPFGLFEQYARQFERIWATTEPGLADRAGGVSEALAER
jgi:hypothetical protein